jgi:hypothetical protein
MGCNYEGERDYTRMQYQGIKNDPLGKTNELYHVRTYIKEEEDKTDQFFDYYYRVSDLVQVYVHYYKEWMHPFEVQKGAWTEHLDGGRTEYQGTFTKSDFHVPGCIYTVTPSLFE